MAASKARLLSRKMKDFVGAGRFFRNYSLFRPPERQPFTIWRPVGDPSCFSSEFSPTGRLLSVIPSAIPGFRCFSVSAEPLTVKNTLEEIYVQDGTADAPVADSFEAEVDGGCDVPLPKAKAPEARKLMDIEKEAWRLLKKAVVNYCGKPVGTVAANDPTEMALNYDQVFIRDFVPSAIAFLLKGDSEIVRNFLLHTLQLQALFYSALRCAREMITVNDGSRKLVHAINSRLSALSFHIREYYWVDMKKINEIYRYKTEEYSYNATNKFNIYPDQIPSWLVDWIPERGGYLIGNLQPAHMDFRFFSLGNLWAIVSSLATPKQADDILNLLEDKWDDLISNMPLKICYPALEYEEWRIITGSDPKNTPWSYHNGGSWPTLLWQFTLACIKNGRPGIAERAVMLAEKRLWNDKWPEYYDTHTGRFIGKQARLYQTWTIAGYLTSKMLLDNPEMAAILTCDEDLELLEFCICGQRKSSRTKCSRLAARSQVLV